MFELNCDIYNIDLFPYINIDFNRDNEYKAVAISIGWLWFEFTIFVDGYTIIGY